LKERYRNFWLLKVSINSQRREKTTFNMKVHQEKKEGAQVPSQSNFFDDIRFLRKSQTV